MQFRYPYDLQQSVDHLYRHFYRVPRMGALELSDGGGPFGFDIAVAVRIDYIVKAFACDAIIETGSHWGDTTDYLSRTYPHLPVWSCDIASNNVDFARHRLRHRSNVRIECLDSPLLVEHAARQFAFPLYYLDAHWFASWPLVRELAAIRAGAVCIDDFNVNDARFAYDSYSGIICDINLLPTELRPQCYTDNHEYDIGLPCLQTGRRGGKCYLSVNSGVDHFAASALFRRLPMP